MGCFVAVLSGDGEPIDERLLRRMMDVPPYRRLSDRDVWTDGPVALAFTGFDSEYRCGEAAASASRSERLRAVMDGRLDERDALIRRLQTDAGRDLVSASDVELVLLAYQSWGSGCMNYLLGDFSFCIWDAGQRRLFCARDHFGVKPLYYARIGSTLVVSNVLRSLRRHPLVSGRLNDEAIGDFLLFGLCLEPAQTSFAEIARLPPAHTLTATWPGGVPRVERYWTLRPGAEVRYRDSREYVQRFRDALALAVSDRLHGGPVGMLMSGGLDSSSIAATAADRLGSTAPTNLRAFTAVYDTVAEDKERQYSSLVARALGIGIEHIAVDAYQLFDRWNGNGLPAEPSSEPMTAVMADLLERASRHGSILLAGDGGDSIMLPSTVVSHFGRVMPGVLASNLWRSFVMARTLPPLGLRSTVRRWWSRDTTGVPEWLGEPLLRRFDPHARWKQVIAMRAPAARTRGAAISDLLDPWWTSTFECHDAGATQRPVDLRYPFFDVRLVSLLMTFPSFPWCVNKAILRTAMRGRLPEDVRVRSKSPLAAGAVHAHGRWTLPRAMAAIEAVPEMAHYVDLRKFQLTARPENLLAADEPGTLAAVALATWLRCTSAASMAA